MKTTRLLKSLLLGIFLSIIAVFLILECSYRLCLVLPPDLPTVRNYMPFSSIVEDAIWASFYEDGRSNVTPLMPWSIFTYMFGRQNPPGGRITSFVSNKLVDTNKLLSERMLIHHFQVLSLGIWISRNWTTEQTIQIAASYLIYKDFEGINNISSYLFRKEANSLALGEICTLLAVTKGDLLPKGENQVEQVHARRNQILEKMFANGAISEKDFIESTNQAVIFTPGK
jgi:hypothetical protein